MTSHFSIAQPTIELAASKLGLLGHRPIPIQTEKVKDVFAKIDTDGATAVFILHQIAGHTSNIQNHKPRVISSTGASRKRITSSVAQSFHEDLDAVRHTPSVLNAVALGSGLA